ncbi:MAG: hypothetical protein K0R68_3339 [Mycobacterium sp.]|nr:hypothetical protein [Mycobacterium sp.]
MQPSPLEDPVAGLRDNNTSGRQATTVSLSDTSCQGRSARTPFDDGTGRRRHVEPPREGSAAGQTSGAGVARPHPARSVSASSSGSIR